MKMTKLATATMTILLSTVLSTTVASADTFDPVQADTGSFDVDFKACTADGHEALVHLRMTNYSPVDPIPDGYTQATKEEVQAVAAIVFPANFLQAFQRDGDALVVHGNYLADIAMEDVEVIDQGKPVKTSRAIKAMNEVKETLMRTLKYSGIGINYLQSKVTLETSVQTSVQTSAPCNP